MINLLFSLIFAEMFLIVILSFKTPLRKLAILALDKVKRGKGPIIVKTVSVTIFVVLLSSLYNIYDIQSRSEEAATINPTDQVLMERHLLQASLMGFSLFLALMVDRIHHYIRELRMLRKGMKALKDSQGFGDGKAKPNQLESESMMKSREGKVA